MGVALYDSARVCTNHLGVTTRTYTQTDTHTEAETDSQQDGQYATASRFTHGGSRTTATTPQRLGTAQTYRHQLTAACRPHRPTRYLALYVNFEVVWSVLVFQRADAFQPCEEEWEIQYNTIIIIIIIKINPPIYNAP